MKKSIKSFLLLVICLMLFGCVDSTVIPKVELSVSSKIKDSILKIAPSKDYAFYVLKDSLPQEISDLQNRVLLFCDDKNIEVSNTLYVDTPFTDLLVAVATIDTGKKTLFSASKAYFLSNAVSGAPIKMKESQFKINGTNINFPRESLVFPQNKGISNLLADSIKYMKNNPNSVLLTKRNIKFSQQRDFFLAEIVFKN